MSRNSNDHHYMAFAMATGFAPTEYDRNCDKVSRRQRYERKKATKREGRS